MNLFSYEPWPIPETIHKSDSRHRVVVAGRRGGKSVMISAEAAQMCKDVEDKWGRSAWGWVVAPTTTVLNSVVIPMCKAMWEPVLYEFQESKRVAILSWPGSKIGHKIEFRSADEDIARLKGPALDWAILDEAAGIRKAVYWECIRPALADRLGRSLITTTPRGRDWVFDVFQWGQKEEHQYKSWHYCSKDNPYFPEGEWETAKAAMDELTFRQEMMAEFLTNVRGVFRNVGDCIVEGCLAEPQKGHSYVLGVDIARINDFTVLTCMDRATRKVVAWERFNEINWVEQKRRTADMARKYNNALCCVDSTANGGDIFCEMLEGEEVRVERITFTSKVKKNLIEKLVVAIEDRQIAYPRIPQLMLELDDYQYLYDEDTRKFSYSAPPGKYDDSVISLALANWVLGSETISSISRTEGVGSYDHMSDEEIRRMFR